MTSNNSVIVVGAGVGGLSAALRLARRGLSVRVFEARATAGGLAGEVEHSGLEFDAGPYVLLDRPGLEWVFDELGLDLDEALELQPIDDVYEVEFPDGSSVGFHASLEQTAARMDARWPGTGKRYERFVTEVTSTYRRLLPLQRRARPSPWALIRHGAVRDVPFLLSSLARVLGGHGFPLPLVQAISIWTHVAGQSLDSAPSPLAFVPALIHEFGAYLPRRGIAQVSRSLLDAARDNGVEITFNCKIERLLQEGKDVRGVVTEHGEEVSSDAVVLNSSGIGAYLELVEGVPAGVKRRLSQLPLQSPGVCAYLRVRGPTSKTYMRFFLPESPGLCRLFVDPAAVHRQGAPEEWRPVRLIAPMKYDDARDGGREHQERFLERIVKEAWWQRECADVEVLELNTPTTWGRGYNLFRESMNPVMTARFMRKGRLAHRSPYFERLYLAGSSTHPGQWVSFCAISGLLAADQLHEDLSR